MYDDVRRAESPAAALMEFLQSTYRSRRRTLPAGTAKRWKCINQPHEACA